MTPYIAGIAFTVVVAFANARLVLTSNAWGVPLICFVVNLVTIGVWVAAWRNR